MKLSFTILSLAAIVVGKGIQSAVPDCAASCISSAVTSVTSCSVTDAACQCTLQNYKAVYTAALSCIMNACGAGTTLGMWN